MTAPAIDCSVILSSGAFKAIVEAGIGSLALGVLLVQEDLDQRVGHGLRVAANRIDIVVGQADGLVAQQEATTLDWQEVSRVTPFDQVVHGGSVPDVAGAT